MSVYDKIFHLSKSLNFSFDEGNKVLYKAKDGWREAEIVNVVDEERGIYIIRYNGELIKTNKIIPYLTEETLREVVRILAEALRLDIMMFERSNIREDTTEIVVFVKGEDESEENYVPLDAIATNKKSAYFLIIDLIYELITRAQEVVNE